DRAIAVVPDGGVAIGGAGNPFAAENIAVYADDQDLLVIGAVENSDLAAFRKIAGGAPEKVVLQFGGAGMFVAEHLAALGVDAGHDVPYCAVFSRRVHRLKDQQDCIAIGRVEKLLLRAQIRKVSSRSFLYCSFDLYTGSTFVGHFLRSI